MKISFNTIAKIRDIFNILFIISFGVLIFTFWMSVGPYTTDHLSKIIAWVLSYWVWLTVAYLVFPLVSKTCDVYMTARTSITRKFTKPKKREVVLNE